MSPFGKRERPMEFSLAGMRVMFGCPVNRDFPVSTTMSLLETCLLLQRKGVPLECRVEVGGSVIEFSRSLVVDNFLKSDMTHLFMFDSDIAWKAQDALRLVCLATKMDVVGAIYPAKREPSTFMLQADESVVSNEYGCIPIHGMGLGFTIVSRRVLEGLADKAPRLKFPSREEKIPHIFRCDADENDEARGEDMAFFADVRALGYSVNLDPTIQLGHIGSKTYSGDIRDALQK